MAKRRRPSNYQLVFTYVLPYFAYILALMLPETLVPKAAAYGLALVLATGALAWGWRWYVPLRGPRSLAGSIAAGLAGGVAGTALWVVIKAPVYEAGGDPGAPADVWMRLLVSGSVVAVFEELLFRGLVLRGALQWDELRRAGHAEPLASTLHDHDVGEVAAGAWTPFAVVFSSLTFAAGHAVGEWPAAIAYGLLMAGLWIWRKDLVSCVVAHGTTNVTLALWVLYSGQWSAW